MVLKSLKRTEDSKKNNSTDGNLSAKNKNELKQINTRISLLAFFPISSYDAITMAEKQYSLNVPISNELSDNINDMYYAKLWISKIGTIPQNIFNLIKDDPYILSSVEKNEGKSERIEQALIERLQKDLELEVYDFDGFANVSFEYLIKYGGPRELEECLEKNPHGAVLLAMHGGHKDKLKEVAFKDHESAYKYIMNVKYLESESDLKAMLIKAPFRVRLVASRKDIITLLRKDFEFMEKIMTNRPLLREWITYVDKFEDKSIDKYIHTYGDLDLRIWYDNGYQKLKNSRETSFQ